MLVSGQQRRTEGLLHARKAEQGGKCKTVAINFLVAPEATPALLEMLRRETGATEIRVEEPGKGYTKEHNADRLRVIVDENNLMQSFMCG